MKLYSRCYQLWKNAGEPCAYFARFLRYRVLRSWWAVAPQPQAERPTAVSKKRPSVDVSIIIPCHNYGHFLAQAIESALQQTVRPVDIVVVDDASSDNTKLVTACFAEQGVRYMHVELRSLSPARNAGAKATTGAWLCYLDADDRLPPDYLERCLEKSKGSDIGIVYTDRWHFGENDQRTIAPPFSREELTEGNYISANALIRRQAFDLVGGFRDIPHSMEDWDFFLRVTRLGYKAIKAETYLHYRVHSDSMLQKHLRSPHFTYTNDAALTHQPLTIFSPFAGRREVFESYLEGLRSIALPPEHIAIHWFNTSEDPGFDAMLRKALVSLPFGRLTYTRAPLPKTWGHTPKSLIRQRIDETNDAEYYYQMAVVHAYSHMILACDTDYVLTVEDDIVLKPETISLLQRAMDRDVAAVVAPYRSGFYPRYEVWVRREDGTLSHFKEHGNGIQEVGGCGFGCTLFRTPMLRAIAPIRTGVHDRPRQWYDQLTYLRLREYGRILCNWDAEVSHLKTERYAENLSPTFT